MLNARGIKKPRKSVHKLETKDNYLSRGQMRSTFPRLNNAINISENNNKSSRKYVARHSGNSYIIFNLIKFVKILKS